MDSKLRQSVQLLLNSSFSQYEISKATGFPQPNLSSLRNGKRIIGDMSVSTAEKLADYWNEVMGIYTVATFKTTSEGMTITDELTDYGELFSQDAWDMIDTQNTDFGRDLVDGDRVDIAGGPNTDYPWITVSLTGFNEGTYWFDEDASDHFRKTWLAKLVKWDFLKED